MKITKMKLLLALPLFLAAPFVNAQTTDSITLKKGLDGYDGVSDLAIQNRGRVNFNNGAATYVGIGGTGGDNPQLSSKLLLRFDLSDYAGRTVSGDATIRLFQVNSSATGTGPFFIDYYQIAAANADWVQGTTNDAVAAVGESAWNFKAKGSGDASTNTSWAGSAGLKTAGVDYLVGEGGAAMGTITYTPSDNLTYLSITIPESVLQFWIDNPAANGGIILVRRDSEVVNSYGLGNVILSNRLGSGASYSNNIPELNFNLQQIPEASTYAMLVGVVVAGVAVVARRRKQSR